MTATKGKDRFNRSRTKMAKLADTGRSARTLDEFMAVYAQFVNYCAFIEEPYTVGSRHDDRLMLSSIGIASEAGELLDVLKKVYFHDKKRAGTIPQARRDRAKAEAGDVLWYFMVWLQAMGFTFRDIMQDNMDALTVRA